MIKTIIFDIGGVVGKILFRGQVAGFVVGEDIVVERVLVLGEEVEEIVLVRQGAVVEVTHEVHIAVVDLQGGHADGPFLADSLGAQL